MVTNLKNKNTGLGISSVIDRIGPSQNTSVAIDFAYHLKLNDKNLRLGLGLKVSGRSYQLDNSMISPFNSSDLVFTSPIDSKFSPNIGAGIYLQSQKFYFWYGNSIFSRRQRSFIQKKLLYVFWRINWREQLN